MSPALCSPQLCWELSRLSGASGDGDGDSPLGPGTMWRLGRQRKIFQLAAIQVVKTEVSEQGPKAGKLLLDDTPIEKTGQQIEGSRVDS